MTNPIIIDFPDGLSPEQYAAIHAISEGLPTAAQEEWRAKFEQANGTLMQVALDVGIPAIKIIEMVGMNPKGDDYQALREAIKAAAPVCNAAAPRRQYHEGETYYRHSEAVTRIMTDANACIAHVPHSHARLLLAHLNGEVK